MEEGDTMGDHDEGISIQDDVQAMADVHMDEDIVEGIDPLIVEVIDLLDAAIIMLADVTKNTEQEEKILREIADNLEFYR